MMTRYHQLLVSHLDSRKGDPFPNGTSEHASLLVKEFFRTATRSIRILTTDLNARVYGTPDIVAVARQFLASREHVLEVIFDGEIGQDEITYHPLLGHVGCKNNVHLWRLTPEAASGIRSHFILMDDDSYRLEPDKERPSGIAAFGDREFSQRLSSIFENLKSHTCIEIKAYPVQ
jgi:hypothetical protein